MAKRTWSPWQIRWATAEEFDPAQVATIIPGPGGNTEFWAAIVVTSSSAIVALGGTRDAIEGHGVPMHGASPDIGNPTWTWRRDGDYIALSMSGVEIARIKESGAQSE